MLNFFLLNLMIISRAAGWTDDYWSNDFDPDKDCAQEEKIAKLQNQVKLPSSMGWANPMGGSIGGGTFFVKTLIKHIKS